MKLHYSQTCLCSLVLYGFVLLPYEITLFSNVTSQGLVASVVLLPYEITLFSNGCVPSDCNSPVLLPYEITLFSNTR